MTATRSPNRPRNLATVCGVSEISGTSTQAVLPCARTASMACRYTSVLPLPVTPSTNTTDPSARSQALEMAERASCWPSVSRMRGMPSVAGLGGRSVAGGMPRIRRRRSMAMTPFSASDLRALATLPYSSVSSAALSSPPCRADRICACLTAFFLGSKSAAAGPSLTQRSSTSPTVGCSSRQ